MGTWEDSKGEDSWEQKGGGVVGGGWGGGSECCLITQTKISALLVKTCHPVVIPKPKSEVLFTS